MKICFKEVGQGDSVVLEWESEGQKKIALIDCNHRKDNSNPTLNYVMNAAVNEIEFLILTHPHTDHFSGMQEILMYCGNNSIHIKRFMHTSYISPDFLRSSVKGAVASKALHSLFLQVDQMEKKGQIGRSGYISVDHAHVDLGNEWKLEFLAPSPLEFKYFIEKKFLPSLEEKGNNAAANYLSTIIRIYNTQNQFALLTSDAVSEVFERILSKNAHLFDKSTPLLVGQISHHGAKDNFHQDFWNTCPRQLKAPTVFSVGPNQYGHPSEEVINILDQINYTPIFTNPPIPKQSSISQTRSISLSYFSEPSAVLQAAVSKGDKWFDLDQLSAAIPAN